MPLTHLLQLQSADLLESVTSMALRARLKECGDVKVSVSCDIGTLMSGRINSVKLHGQGWRSPLNLTAQVLEVSRTIAC